MSDIFNTWSEVFHASSKDILEGVTNFQGLFLKYVVTIQNASVEKKKTELRFKCKMNNFFILNCFEWQKMNSGFTILGKIVSCKLR